MKIGIIGTGNMGSVLIQAFSESAAVSASQLVITNRTKQKADHLQVDYPDLNVADDASQIAREADIIFVCVKPLDIQPLVQTLSADLSQEKLLVSITSPVNVNELESIAECSVARAIPSITNRALAGASLITFGSSCSDKQQQDLLALMGHISTPYQIEENITRVASDIISCGPAFFSYLTQRFIQAAATQTDITYEQATHFATEMLIGLGELLEKEIYTLPGLQEKVHVKGGVTGVGLSVLEAEIGDMFERLYLKTHQKFKEDRKKVQNQFHPQ